MMLFKSALAGWLWRRLLDWGGWIGTIAAFFYGLYAALPPSSQAAVGRALQGDWQEITLGAALPVLAVVVSQVFSLRATIKPQVVTPDGKKADLKELPKATQTVVREQTETVVAKRPSLIDLFRRK